MPSAEAVIIGGLLADVLAVFAERAKAAGIADEEITTMIFEAKVKAMNTDPANLPDGR